MKRWLRWNVLEPVLNVFGATMYRRPLKSRPKRYARIAGARLWIDRRNGNFRLHRLHGPAAEWEDGHKDWYYRGQLDPPP